MNKLPVPENISLRSELWRGFGWPEAAKSGVVCAVVLAAVILFSLVHQGENDVLISGVTMMFSVAFCVGFFGKVPATNQSIYDFFRQQVNYQKEQQKYPYCKKKEAYSFVKESEC